MPILNNIPRKNNYVPTRTPYTSPFPGPPAGHISVLAYPGLDYNSPFTDAETQPLATHLNISTQPQLPPLKGNGAGRVTPLHTFVRLSPTEKSQSYSPRIHKARPIVSRSGGVSTSTNTPFHPKAKGTIAIPVPQPSVTTEKPTTAVAVATGQQKNVNNLAGRQPGSVGSFLHTGGGRTISSHPYNDQAQSRWSTVKTGAAE
jgi:hypothetical protein